MQRTRRELEYLGSWLVYTVALTVISWFIVQPLLSLVLVEVPSFVLMSATWLTSYALFRPIAGRLVRRLDSESRPQQAFPADGAAR